MKIKNIDFATYLKKYPTRDGFFGKYGGAYIPDELKKPFQEIDKAYQTICHSAQFINELRRIRKEFQGRPTPVYHCSRLSEYCGGAQIYVKREDLNHTGAHKINNAIGQGLVAKHMGKKKLIAETGAGQHGVATATIAAYLGMECDVYMGARDIEAQKPNVYRMKILGANVIPVTQGQGTLKDAVDVALENFLKDCKNSYYLLGSAVGPHPYPTMVRDFQKIIGEEIRQQMLELEGCLPKAVIACVGGGSNAIGAIYDFIEDKEVELVAVEAGGKGKVTGKHGLALQTGKPRVLHGFKTLVLVDEKDNVKESYSIASGLDYPGVGPELSMLKEQGRLSLGEATDKEALEAFLYLSKVEGLIPALESAHAIAYILRESSRYDKDDIVVINLSGRGDKDVENVYERFLKT